jgi:uncharacterized membrane protein YoaK (UPF0700 family)
VRLTGTFVAFQSGNTVLAGLRLGQGEFAAAWPSLTAVLAYIVGSALTPFVIRSGRTGIAGAPSRLLTWASVLLSLDAAIVLIGFGTGSETPDGVLRYLGLIAVTFAMAMQTPVARTVDGVLVSSTFSSGMLVRLGQSLGDLLHPSARARERAVTRILGVINLAFLGGAIVGGILIELVDNASILVPTLALITIAVVRRRSAAEP